MDKKQFAEKVSNPVMFTSQERGWLKAMLSKYPYSSAVGVLSLLADHVYGYDTPEERRAVALSVCNPAMIDRLLAGAMSDAAVETVSAPVQEEEHPFDVLNEINTFQEVSFKTAPKSVILSNFLPFLRRAASTFLPLAVDILLRKPCLFALFLSEGWNVLFIFQLYFFVFFRQN